MNYFPDVKKWIIPEEAFQSAIEELARSGGEGVEGICLWLGNRDSDGIAEITHSVILRSPDVKRSPLNITIQPQVMHSIHEKAIENSVILVGQIHSHSEECGTDLSIVDRKYGLSVPGYLSIVAPDYCRKGKVTITECGVHVYKPSDGYVRLSAQEVSNRVVIDHKRKSPVIIVY